MAAKSEAAQTPELVSAPMELTIHDLENPSRRRSQDGPQATVHVSGLTKLNRSATDHLDDMAQAKGLAIETYKVKFGSNKQTGFVGAYPVDPNTAGSVMIKHDKRHKLVTLYLQSLFEKEPGLAPAEKRTCVATPGTDTKGNTCLMIGITSALEKQKKATTGTKQNKASNTENA